MAMYNRLVFGVSSRNTVLRMYKYGAKKRGFSWRLTEKQFDTLTQGVCEFCGRQPRKIKRVDGGYGHFVYNGIDRLDSRKGYTKNNTVSCCDICNKAKRDLPLGEFIAWAKDLGRNMRASK